LKWSSSLKAILQTGRFGACALVVLAILATASHGLTFREGKQKYLVDTSIVISYSVVIPEGVTVIIKPGVRVLFDGYYSFSVHGLIIAEGTADRPIVFSAVDRPTGSQELPQWKGIEIIGKGANGQFKHCRFEGAYRNFVWEGCPSFDSCEFEGNHYALYCDKKASPHVSHCRFLRNVYGIAANFSYPLLMDNTITENTIGLYLQLCSEAIAGKNFISGNETNIRVENALGNNAAPSFSLQNLWDLMQQMY